MRFLRFFLVFLLFSNVVNAQNLDLQLLNDWHQHRERSLDATMNVIGQTTYPITLLVPFGQLVHGFVKHDNSSIELGLQSATTVAVAAFITYGLKYSVYRDRPFIKHPEYVPYEYDSSPSFPSGHTSMAFATATNLSIEYPKWYIIAPSFLYAGVVGYSRIHLGEHYPSDVLAGAIVGAGSAYISYIGNKWMKALWKKKMKKVYN